MYLPHEHNGINQLKINNITLFTFFDIHIQPPL